LAASSQHASIAPSGVGQHCPSMPAAAHAPLLAHIRLPGGAGGGRRAANTGYCAQTQTHKTA
jgi:hypothetical protein